MCGVPGGSGGRWCAVDRHYIIVGLLRQVCVGFISAVCGTCRVARDRGQMLRNNGPGQVICYNNMTVVTSALCRKI